MRMARSVVLLALLLSMSVGCDSCNPTKKTTATTCNGTTCNVVVHVSGSCLPVDASNNMLDHADADVGNTICFFNDSTGSVTLSIPTGVINNPAAPTAPYQEFTVAAGQCISFEVPTTADKQTFGYTIAGASCPPASGGHGNPDIKVGGGSEGGPG